MDSKHVPSCIDKSNGTENIVSINGERSKYALLRISHTEIAIQQLETLEFLTSGAGHVVCNGQTLTTSNVAAVSRFGSPVQIASDLYSTMLASVENLQAKLTNGEVIYGVNTLFGGSADLRTKQTIQLQETLIREFHIGILPELGMKSKVPSDANETNILLESPPEGNHIPYTWARAAVLIRLNSLVKGFSGVRPTIAERLNDLLNYDIIPIIPLRGSISASGDLSPLSYIAGALQGKRTIRIFSKTDKQGLTADRAFANAKLIPINLQPKEGLAIVNGTAISCAAATLTLHDTHGIAVLAQLVTAMSVEALQGTAESFHPMFTKLRPHPGQVESARNILHFLTQSKLTVTNDGEESVLRQDRYSIRTAPQWIGPVLEDLVLAHQQITIECNSTTDNPLISPNGPVLHGGNFQAKAVTSAMEKTRQGLHTIGRMVFVQSTEIINPVTNRGLPPNLVAEDPSTSNIFKPIDITMAALLSELGFLATPVDHVQNAEMGNQSLNSLALISARYTHMALDVLSQLVAASLVTICQALDLRALQLGFLENFKAEFCWLLRSYFGVFEEKSLIRLEIVGWNGLLKGFNATTCMDTSERFYIVAKAVREVLLDYEDGANIRNIAKDLKPFVDALAKSLQTQWIAHRDVYLESGDASPFLGIGSKRIYGFIRGDLGVPLLHTKELLIPEPELSNLDECKEAPTVGYFISTVYRAIRDGKLTNLAIQILRENKHHAENNGTNGS